MIKILNELDEQCQNCDKAVGYNEATWQPRTVDIIFDDDIDPETGSKKGMLQGYTNCGYHCPYDVPRKLGVLD